MVWKVVQLVLGTHGHESSMPLVLPLLAWGPSHNPGTLVGLEPTTLTPHFPPVPPPTHTHSGLCSLSPTFPPPHSSSETWGPQPTVRQAKSLSIKGEKFLVSLPRLLSQGKWRQTQHPVSLGFCVFHSSLSSRHTSWAERRHLGPGNLKTPV